MDGGNWYGGNQGKQGKPDKPSIITRRIIRVSGEGGGGHCANHKNCTCIVCVARAARVICCNALIWGCKFLVWGISARKPFPVAASWVSLLLPHRRGAGGVRPNKVSRGARGGGASICLLLLIDSLPFSALQCVRRRLTLQKNAVYTKKKISDLRLTPYRSVPFGRKWRQVQHQPRALNQPPPCARVPRVRACAGVNVVDVFDFPSVPPTNNPLETRTHTENCNTREVIASKFLGIAWRIARYPPRLTMRWKPVCARMACLWGMSCVLVHFLTRSFSPKEGPLVGPNPAPKAETEAVIPICGWSCIRRNGSRKQSWACLGQLKEDGGGGSSAWRPMSETGRHPVPAHVECVDRV